MSLCVSESVVLDALKGVFDPHLNQDVVCAKQIKNLRIEGGRIALDLELSYPGLSVLEGLRLQVMSVLSSLPGVEQVDVFPSIRIPTHAVQRGLKPLPQVKNIIAVASGKGGVGKSTTAANLALALAAEGAKVGILDADIYGPSLPTILGIEGRPSAQENTMEPMIGHGLQTMSIGFLVDQDTPMIWRGPMVSGALEQLLKQTRWHDLDYLILDMPPGTGDVQLTVSQKVPLTGAVLVTTPQDIALLDAKKGLKMFEKVGVPILGIVENMAVHVCTQCGHAEHIFGQGGGQSMADEYHVHYLGGLPLDIRIRQQADAGCPTVVAEPDGLLAQAYKKIAREVAVRLAEQARDMSLKFPTIVVQNT